MNHPQEPKEQEFRSPMPPNSAPDQSTAEQAGCAENPPEAAPAAESAAAKKAHGKSRAKKLLLGMLVALAVLLLLNLIPFDQLTTSAVNDLPEETEPVVTYGDAFFAIPDYDEDVTQDEIYMKYNRLLTFTRDGESFAVTAETADGHGAVCLLFQKYMEALMAGDSDACNALFTDEYLEENGTLRFAPQKVYDMKVSVVRSQVLTDGDANGEYKGYTVTYCEVAYKLRQNNGTLRRDFYREGDTRSQIFEVLEKDDVAKINEISSIRSAAPQVSESKGESILMYVIWIAVIALAIIIEASTAALTAVWFLPGALVALILALCDLSVTVQVVVFAVLSLASLAVGITLFRKRLRKKFVPTNADRLIGMEGVVSERIDNLAAMGEVKADGKRWSARSEDGSVIEEGEIVTVLRIEGVKLIVEKK